jgi:hypothetical protein
MKSVKQPRKRQLVLLKRRKNLVALKLKNRLLRLLRIKE